MFARQCTRLATSKTAVPLSSYLARVRGYSSAAGSYEHILTSTPKPGVGLSMSLMENGTSISILTPFCSHFEPSQGPQRPLHASLQGAQ
jgi:hypothetical protein